MGDLGKKFRFDYPILQKIISEYSYSRTVNAANSAHQFPNFAHPKTGLFVCYPMDNDLSSFHDVWVTSKTSWVRKIWNKVRRNKRGHGNITV